MKSLPILLLLLCSTASAAPQQTFLCEDSPLDVFPDVRFNCEAHQSFRKGFDRHALQMFKQAARWGSKQAQYKIGLMYLGGFGAAENPIEGTAWLLLANERNPDQDTAQLSDALAQLSPYEQQQAHARAAELRESYGDAKALERRARWVRRAKRRTTGSRTGNPMASVRNVNSAGITGDQRMSRLDRYEASLRDVLTTVEYRDFDVLDEAPEPNP